MRSKRRCLWFFLEISPSWHVLLNKPTVEASFFFLKLQKLFQTVLRELLNICGYSFYRAIVSCCSVLLRGNSLDLETGCVALLQFRPGGCDQP